MYWISVETMDPAGNTSIENFGGACKGILPIELCTFAEDFDGPFGGWSHAADAGTDTWRVASFPDARTPPSAWFVEDSDRLADSALATPPFLVPPGSFLLFWHTFALESGFDGAVIEISVDGGQKWEDLGPRITAGGYNGTVGGSNPLGERRVWTGGAIGPMRQVLVTLEEFAGKLAQIRFRIGCDGSFGGDGWYVDDVRICKSVRERGALSFDRFAYPCRSDVVVEVSDTGLLAGPLTVRVTSTSERAGEAIQLIETPAGSRRFLASLPISTIDWTRSASRRFRRHDPGGLLRCGRRLGPRSPAHRQRSHRLRAAADLGREHFGRDREQCTSLLAHGLGDDGHRRGRNDLRRGGAIGGVGVSGNGAPRAHSRPRAGHFVLRAHPRRRRCRQFDRR
jgi:hypothetical protein